jgi:hypothetical protein
LARLTASVGPDHTITRIAAARVAAFEAATKH